MTNISVKRSSDAPDDPPFFQQIRIQRDILDNPLSPKAQQLWRWVDRLTTMAGGFGKPVGWDMPVDGGNRMSVHGYEANTFVTGQLIRKAVIEIGKDEFDGLNMLDFAEAKFENYVSERDAKHPPLLSCRVNFHVAIEEGMDFRQSRSFKRLSRLFDQAGIAMTPVENRPTVVELRSENPVSLKAAGLTAEWAAQNIASRREITQNGLNQCFNTRILDVTSGSRSKQPALSY